MALARNRKKEQSKSEVKDLLVQNNIITKKQLMEIQNQGEGKNSDQLIEFLLNRGDVEESDVLNVLAKQYNCQIINIEDFDFSPDLARLIPAKFCIQHNIIPVSKISDTIVVACSNPSNIFVKERLVFLTGCKIEFVLASREAIYNTIQMVFEETEDNLNKLFAEIESSNINFQKKHQLDDDNEQQVVIKLDKNDPEPIVRCVNQILSRAISKGSSDIHIESYEKTCRIRYRIDGKLQEFGRPPKSISNFLISRFKVMSHLDIAEKRKPQDGRLKVVMDKGKEIDFRISIAPTVGGEKIVLRILESSNLAVDVEKLGMSEDEKKIFVDSLKAPQGLILICGPTGSGKTTTIYSGLQLLNTKSRNISTAEDPVEFKIEGLNQVQVLPKIGLTFASTLRSFLRQDPDVMFVGEIRDFETAEIAFKASSTGHLVLSTIHTNDTPSVVTRLLDIGIPDYSISDNISLIVGQRLLRRVCKKCAVVDHISRSSLEILGLNTKEMESAKNSIRKGVGCRTCSGTGYKGRVAVFELLKITENVKKDIFAKTQPLEIKRRAIVSGDLRTVRRNGIKNMLAGITSFEEVMYGTMEDPVV